MFRTSKNDGSFDAFASHDDEITELPAGATVLSGNSWTRVQAISVTHENGEFWGLQYHPEYDLHELSRLTHCRMEKLVGQGFFEDQDAARAVRNTSVRSGCSSRR